MAVCRAALYPMHTELPIQNIGNGALCGMQFYAVTFLRYRLGLEFWTQESGFGSAIATDHTVVKVLQCKYHKPRLQPL